MTADTGWTKHEFLAELRAAGWRRISDAARIYQSPAGARFHLDEYHADVGILWRFYAERRELPDGAVLSPWELRLREKMREARGE